MPERILYLKPGCPWCTEVENYLQKQQIDVTKKIVSGNRENMDEMVQLSGQSKAPTLNWEGKILADFGVDELIPFLEKMK